MKFTQELKDKWLAALRGGEFKQGMGRLCTRSNSETKYCCLGVLAEVSGFFGKYTNDLERAYTYKNDLNTQMLIFGDVGAVLIHDDVQNILATQNDSGRSFAEIADWIEANIPAEVE